MALPHSDEADFAAFVAMHSRSLFRTAYLLTGSSNDAEELLQDTLVHLYPKWSRVRASDSAVAYVRRSVTNRFISSRRRASANDVSMWELPDAPDDVDVAGGVTDSETVWQLLNDLPPRQRAVLVLRYFHDLPDEQIAEHLQCRRSTVRSLARRGLAATRSGASAHANPVNEPVWELS